MTFFDIDKDELLRLSDTQLEELVARLAEADVSAAGFSPASVHWSGSINAPDGGVDIRVTVATSELNTGFLVRPETIFQAKVHTMPASSIASEMCPRGALSAAIADQARRGGGYVVVSLADDCSPTMREDRLHAMQSALATDPNCENLHIDFFDRSRLLLWVRQHPSVMLWVRGILGRGYTGWQPYGRWSNPPVGSDDTLISAPGVSVVLPANADEKLSVEEAIEPLRELVRSSSKAIRVTGLSGVGKTRIVQALFDESVGENALDRTTAIYVDVGASPDPSANSMIDTLISENRCAVVVLDNCPSELHSALASKVSATVSNVSLVTVEYDIRDDKPQTTEVVQIEADGPDLSEALLLRRFPQIGQLNARKIAEFANGNARVSLAVAERVEVGEPLAHLSDAQLFDRLFEQRNQPNGELRSHAEALSLVYSFSVSSPEVGFDELLVLGEVYDIPRVRLYRSVATLLERQIAQSRSHWRAVLPHAIANRLAADALNGIPIETLRATFEAPGRDRLLMSFAHRLGLMHDHPVAQQVVEQWLQEGELLGQISTLDDSGARILDYVAPVAPSAVLDRIEAVIGSDSFTGFETNHDSRRTTILRLLQSLAYDAELFDRCVALLLRVCDFEDESNNYDAVRDKVIRFFQAYLSGTHASLDQRLAVVRGALTSQIPGRQPLGSRMLSAALDGPPWMGSGSNDFGARPRDFGYRPNHEQLVEWRTRFLDLAIEFGLSDDPEVSNSIRRVVASEFRGLWHQAAMRPRLIAAARELNTGRPWVEGWAAVRSTIYFDYRRNAAEADDEEADSETLPEELIELETELAPIDLLSNIRTFVLGSRNDYWDLDENFHDNEPDQFEASERRLSSRALELGAAFSASGRPVAELGQELFSSEWKPRRRAFGRGLARGAEDFQFVWAQLVEQFYLTDPSSFDFGVLCGFIEELDSQDRALAQALLDMCAEDQRLRRILVGLHPSTSFERTDFERCLAVLPEPDTAHWMYGDLLWRDEYQVVSEPQLVGLAEQLLEKPNGDDVVLQALTMKLHRTDSTVDTLGAALRRVGLNAAIARIARNQSDAGGSSDHNMQRVVRASLSFEGNEDLKTAWLDTIFSVVDEHYGYMHGFDHTIKATAELLPHEFLNLVFSGDEDTRQRRLFIIERGGMDKLPLSGIEIDTLIGWCKDRSNPEVWPVVGAGIEIWATNTETQETELEEDAMRFLEASPNPAEVLETFANNLEPRSGWSGSRAGIMQTRLDALRPLAQHSRPEISVAAGELIVRMSSSIEQEQRRQQIRDTEREQKFE